MNKELIAKAKEAKSVEELLALARENNIELTEEQAKECYDRLQGTDELSDDELEKVAGGVTDEEFKLQLDFNRGFTFEGC